MSRRPVLPERGFRGSREWDWRCHETSRMWFKTAEGQDRDDVKRRALTVLRNYCEAAGGVGEPDLEGPLWALADLTDGNERVMHACQWFRIALAYSGDEELRRVYCLEAYGWIERALRYYL